jgi:large subunit ribosomal protein L29
VRAVKPDEIRQMTTEEIKARLAEAYEELMNLRFQLATNQLSNPMRIRQVRRDIARMKTILREREIWEEWQEEEQHAT